jgi:uncharacterized protein YbaR (Trm112 family)
MDHQYCPYCRVNRVQYIGEECIGKFPTNDWHGMADKLWCSACKLIFYVIWDDVPITKIKEEIMIDV